MALPRLAASRFLRLNLHSSPLQRLRTVVSLSSTNLDGRMPSWSGSDLSRQAYCERSVRQKLEWFDTGAHALQMHWAQLVDARVTTLIGWDALPETLIYLSIFRTLQHHHRHGSAAASLHNLFGNSEASIHGDDAALQQCWQRDETKRHVTTTICDNAVTQGPQGDMSVLGMLIGEDARHVGYVAANAWLLRSQDIARRGDSTNTLRQPVKVHYAATSQSSITQ
jgi:hypothetical protein